MVMVEQESFRQMCALSRFTSRVREGSFLSVTEEQSRSSTQKHGLLKGGREKASAISQEASENCRQRTAAAPVLRTPRLSARSGMNTLTRSIMMRENDESARSGGEGAKRRGHCSKANAFRAQAGVSGTRHRRRWERLTVALRGSFRQCTNEGFFFWFSE